MIRLTQDQIMELLEADWFSDGPIRLNESLSLSDLSGCLVLKQGELNAVLFDATFNRYNLAYLDHRPVKESFQAQIGLTLFLMSKVAGTPRSQEDLLAITTLPIDPPQSDFPFRPESVYRARVLRYLEWFGLLETTRMAANDQAGEQHLYRKTPLFDRFLSFDV